MAQPTPKPRTRKLRSAKAVEGERRGRRSYRKSAQTRSRLLKAAKRVFEHDGFLGARISDIAKQAGLSHGSFYNYFDSKEEIFRGVAGAMQENFGAHSVDSRLLGSLSGASLRKWFLESSRRYLDEYQKEARIMGVIEQVSRYDDAVRAARLARREPYFDRGKAAIRSLQRMGLADKRLDPSIVLLALTAMITRFAEMWFVQGEVESSFEHGAEQIAILFMNALLSKDTTEAR